MMRDKDMVALIKETIHEVAKDLGLDVKSIILFGSRARGNYKKLSDWDLLVVVENPLTIKGKMTYSKKLRVSLAKRYIDCDFIIKSEAELEKMQKTIGSVVREALKEGVLL
jgi:predicted nucleotidyltransferase